MRLESRKGARDTDGRVQSLRMDANAAAVVETSFRVRARGRRVTQVLRDGASWVQNCSSLRRVDPRSMGRGATDLS